LNEETHSRPIVCGCMCVQASNFTLTPSWQVQKVKTLLDSLFSERDQPVAERFIIRKLWGWERPLLEPKLVIQSSFCNPIIYLYFVHFLLRRIGCVWDSYLIESSMVKKQSHWAVC
jgi:hypothetical protein